MENIINKTRFCEKCGKKISYKLIEEDGRDWMGHRRGTEKSYTIGYECNCTDYKRMCLNCKHYQEKNCCNSKTIEEYKQKITNDVFDVKLQVLGIKDPTKHCNNWEISKVISEEIFK